MADSRNKHGKAFENGKTGIYLMVRIERARLNKIIGASRLSPDDAKEYEQYWQSRPTKKR
jgi:hypothetical protein